MGESLLVKKEKINNLAALVKVNAVVGTTVTCTCGSTTKSKTAITDVVEFDLSYGTWTISAEIDGKTYSKTLIIDILQVYEITLKGSIFGIAIDMSEGDPEAAVTYTDDAVGFTPLRNSNYGSWTDLIKEFFGCRPCLYYGDGRIVRYLNPDNYAQYEDGTTADITSGNSGNVMVEFKKLYYRYAVDGNILTFQVTDDESAVDNGYTCAAFKSMDGSGTVKDYMYYGAYEGCYINSGNGKFKLMSLSGKEVWTDITLANSRTYCQNNGSSYGMEDWCKRCYILGLTMLVTKTRGIQDAIGLGYLDGDDVGTDNIDSTGGMNRLGLFFGSGFEGGSGVKVFGIENLWGNIQKWCDGIMTKSSTTLGFKDCPPYNSTGSGYTSVADGYPRNRSLYPTSMIPVMDGAAIVPSAGQSDSSLGWCDMWIVDSATARAAIVGGAYYEDSERDGPFQASISIVSNSDSNSSDVRGARIVAS